MIVSIASDHAGYDLRQQVIAHLKEKGFEVLDGGATNGTDAYSYVEAGKKIAEDVLSGRADRGIAICGTGIGISIAANKVPGIRAGVVHSIETAHWTKNHNDANVLCFGARVVDLHTALAMVDEWLSTEFAGGKHERRIKEIEDLDF